MRSLVRVSLSCVALAASSSGLVAQEFYKAYQPGTTVQTRGPQIFCMDAASLQLFLAYHQLDDREKMSSLDGCGIDISIGFFDGVIVERQANIVRVVIRVPEVGTVEYWTPLTSVTSTSDVEAGECLADARTDGEDLFEAMERCN